MKPNVTMERLREVLDYSQDTGLFVWRKSVSSNGLAGTVAGSVQAKGQIHIGIDRKYYHAHRLAWFYVTGEWPTAEIDHKNLIRSDNRFSNLRPANNQQQSANRRVSKNNRLGVKGVNRVAADRYRARIRVNDKLIHLGYYQTPEDASAAYARAAEQSFGEFARPA